ncbi:MAG: hypothetical protein R2711_17050 [Acidimicrobiales bacterium]
MQTRAERDGDEWIVTGQKVWTSGAHYADIGEIICRTDPDLPKHKRASPGSWSTCTPRASRWPLRQMTGGATFNEVFFDEVRVPDHHRLGDVNQGWTVALTTLMNERRLDRRRGRRGAWAWPASRLIEMMRHYGVDQDPVLRDVSAKPPRLPGTSSPTCGPRRSSRREACRVPRCRSGSWR